MDELLLEPGGKPAGGAWNFTINDTSGNVEGGIYVTGMTTTVEENVGSIHLDDS